MKKTISVILIVALVTVAVFNCGCCVAINVNALSSPGYEATYRAVREGQAKLLEAYCNGDISYDEYITKSNELTDTLYDSYGGFLSPEAEKIGNMFQGISNKIGATVQMYGDKAYEYVGEWLSDVFGDKKKQQ